MMDGQSMKIKNNMKKRVGIFTTLLLVGIISWESWFPIVRNNWKYWFLDVDYKKVICSFPEKTGELQNLSAFRICLGRYRIKPTNSDIRKQCSYVAQYEYETYKTG